MIWLLPAGIFLLHMAKVPGFVHLPLEVLFRFVATTLYIAAIFFMKRHFKSEEQTVCQKLFLQFVWYI